MTKPKHAPHRLGFEDQPYRTAHDNREFARWVFLQHVQQDAAYVLRALRAIPPAHPVRPETFDIEFKRAAVGIGLSVRVADLHHELAPDPAELRDWAVTSGLRAPWCLAYARATWRFWQRHPDSVLTWHERDDLEGEQVPHRRRARAPRPLKDPFHFSWLVLYQVRGYSYARIARADRREAQTVREACVSLAAYLRLPLRRP